MLVQFFLFANLASSLQESLVFGHLRKGSLMTSSDAWRVCRDESFSCSVRVSITGCAGY